MANHLDLEEQEQLDQIKHFWSKWGTPITSLIVIAAVAVASWNGYQYWQNRQSAQAASLLDAVDSAARSGDAPKVLQASSDLQSRYGSTVQAAQAALKSAKFQLDAGDLAAAQQSLVWAAEKSADEGVRALARVRLASVLLDQQKFDEALKWLAEKAPAEFEAIFADRRGDILLAQGMPAEATAEYQKAYKLMEPGMEYRRLLEVKLSALGVEAIAAAAPTVGEK